MNEPQPNNPDTRRKKSPARRRVWLLLPVLLLCVAGAYECTLGTLLPVTWLPAKTYRAESEVEIVRHTQAVPDSSLFGVQPQADESMETQVALIQSNEVAERALFWLKNHELTTSLPADTWTLGQIADAVKVTRLPDTKILLITADVTQQPGESNNITRERAGLLANATAYAFKGWKHDLTQRNITESEHFLEGMARKAQQAMELAEKREISFKATTPHSAEGTKGKVAPGLAGNVKDETAHLPQAIVERELRQNTQIATELYQRLQTSLAVTRLQRDSVPGDVIVIRVGTINPVGLSALHF